MMKSTQEETLHDWLETYSNVLFKVIRAYTVDEDDREDLFQEISIRLWHSIPKFEGKCAVSTWIYRIALNVSISWVNRENRRKTEPLKLAQHVLSYTEHEEDPRVRWLYDRIRQFDEVDRSLSLLLLDGYSYKEMSEIIGISESNVGVKIHRIKKILVAQAQKLTEHEY